MLKFLASCIISFGLMFFVIPSAVMNYMSEDNVSISEKSFILSWQQPKEFNESLFLRSLLNIKRANFDNRVKGLYINLDGCNLSFSAAYELSEALKNFQKPIYAYGADISNSGYILACNAKEIYMHPCGVLGLTGVYISSPFAKNLFDKLGISFNLEKREEYKTYANMYTETGMTNWQKEVSKSLIDNFKKLFVDSMAKRGFSDKLVDELIDEGPYARKIAIKNKLIDGAMAYCDFKTKISKGLNEDNYVKFADYEKEYVNTKHPKTIGVICLEGEISDREGRYNDKVISRKGVEKIVQYIKKSAVKYDGYIIRINSPGGSAVASEDICCELKNFLSDSKLPYVVSMGTYAASGGYWIASALKTHIISTPYTITGSIGVIGMLPCLTGLLDKIGVNNEKIESNQNSAFGDVCYNMTYSQKDKFSKVIDCLYEEFLEHVSESRGIAIDQLRKVAKGRAWSGSDALKYNLVDELGTFQTSVKYMENKLLTDKINIVILKQPVPFLALLMSKIDEANECIVKSLQKTIENKIHNFCQWKAKYELY